MVEKIIGGLTRIFCGSNQLTELGCGSIQTVPTVNLTQSQITSGEE